MSSVNKALIIGNLGKEPELKHTANGGSVCVLSIATQSSWKDKATNERKEATEWHRIVLYGQQAEFTAQYIKKGHKVYVEGRLQTRKWQDNQGIDRYTTEIIADTIQSLTPRSDAAFEQPHQKPQTKQQHSFQNDAGVNDLDNDMPF